MLTPPPHFLEGTRALGLDLAPPTIDALAAFLERLLDENTRTNLTAVRDVETAWSRHLLDSLTLLPRLMTLAPKRVIDVGSGGGLPALPLALCLPETRFTLVESVGKKTKFLSESAEALGLAHRVQVLNERAERIGAVGSSHRGQFDVAMARALAPLNVLLELTTPMLKTGGVLLAIKGERADDELAEAERAMSVLACELVSSSRFDTGTVLEIRKTAATPKAYPRAVGQPKKQPL